MGWNSDNFFFLAYWYPQIAVYDDVAGWHADSYLGNAEFHNAFATYDLFIEAPEGWLVLATGRLTNRVATSAISPRLKPISCSIQSLRLFSCLIVRWRRQARVMAAKP